jgi:hypothetical protein
MTLSVPIADNCWQPRGWHYAKVSGVVCRPTNVAARGVREPDHSNVLAKVKPAVISVRVRIDPSTGVQLGEMVRITETGFERLHAAPWGFLRMN